MRKPAESIFTLQPLSIGTKTLQRVCKASARNCKAVWICRRTANSAALRLSALITPNAADISHLADGDWYVIAPYGEFASPDGSYTQVFGKEQADKVVRTWNSISGTAFRFAKSMWHGLGAKFSVPVWDGHPETDKGRWPVERLLGEITELRATASALEGRQTWNAKGMERRTRGPLYPSPLWWHLPPDSTQRVYPELLESIGLVPTPNINAVPAWTQNSSPDSASTTTPKNTDKMDRIALCKKLGLSEDSTDEQINAKIAELQSTANAAAENIRTANSARDAIQGQLSTANTRITALEGEVSTLTSAHNELNTINTALAGGVVHGFQLAGIVTPAERETVVGQLTANATAVSTVDRLKAKKPVMNVTSIQLGATRRDISTANARRQIIDDAVQARMAKGQTYNDAYAACQADPELKPVFDAMANPQTAAA